MSKRVKGMLVLLGTALIVPATASIIESMLPTPTAAIRTDRLAGVARHYPNFTREQRMAVRAETTAQLHPAWKTLSFPQRTARAAMFAQQLLRPRDVVTPAAARFIGNQTLINDLSGDLITLRRESDCSLTLYQASYALSSTMNPTIQFLGSTPHYERILHNASGVTTTAGAFAGGCADPVIGIGTRRAVVMGKTAQGKVFAGGEGYVPSQGVNGLYFGLVDPTLTSSQPSSLDVSLPDLLGVTSGDLNGDGINDVVGTDQQSGRIQVWLAHADGTLAAPTAYVLPGVTTEAAVIADVNGDGKLDVVVATRDGLGSGQEHVSVLTGKGDGTLNAALSVDVPSYGGTLGAASGLTNLIAADLRGRGHPDLLGSNGLVLLNNGSGAFTVAPPAFAAESATSSNGPNVAAGDFDKDGKLDVAVSNGTDVRIFRGQGDGTFTAGERYAGTAAVGYVTATDLDGDGNVDLYLGLAMDGIFAGDQFEKGQGYALMGNGDGTFQGAPSLPFEYSGTNLMDLNGDGAIDAVGVNADHSFTSYLGDGKGGFVAGATLAAASVSIGGTRYTLTGDIDSYALGDINGDGKADLAFISQNFQGPGGGPGVFIALGDGQGGFAAPVFYAAPSTVGQIDNLFQISGLHLADLNRDGKYDLIYAYTDSSGGASSTLYFGTVVQLSNGDGTFHAPQVIPYRSAPYDSGFNPQYNTYVALVSDLNRDGNPDLVFVAQSSTLDHTLSTYVAGVQVALGHGDGTFSVPAAVSGPDLLVASSSRATPASVAIADMNADGIPDLVALGSSTTYKVQVAIALGVGDGTFRAPVKQTYSAQYLNTGQGLAVGDFDGDGKPDVALTDPYSLLGAGVSLGNGDGTLQVNTSSSLTLPSLGINVQADGGAVAYDFNGDGVADILAGSTLLLSQAPGSTPPTSPSPDFALAASLGAGTIAAGQTAQLDLTLTPVNGFNQSVALSCTGLPAGATCGFSPASVTLGGNAATSTLTISTTARTAASTPSRVPPWLPGGTLLAGFLAPLGWRRRDRARSSRLLLALGCLLAFGGCGGHDGDSPSGSGGAPTSGTPAGTSMVAITGSAGSSTHSVTYTLTVS